jgi:hypothetical protein
MLYPIPATTAINNKKIPIGVATSVGFFSLLKMTRATPAIEIMIPKRLNLVIRSLKKKAVAKGLNKGIVEIITAASVEETSLTPRLSHKKYKNGLKKETIAKYLKSVFFNFCILPIGYIIKKRMADEIINLKSTVVIGS